MHVIFQKKDSFFLIFLLIHSFCFVLFRADAAGDLRGKGAPQGEKQFSLDTLWLRSGEAPSLPYTPSLLSYSRPYARNKNWKKWKNEKNEKVNFFSHFKIPKIQLVSCVKEFNFHTYIHIYKIKKSTVKPPLHQVHMILYLVQCQLQVVDKSVSSSWQDKKNQDW